MPSPFEFVLLAFATYRLARLIAVDDGPFDVFLRLRMRAGAYDYAENGEPATSLGRGISCPHCVGVYVAPVVWLITLAPGGWLVVGVLAVAGLQSLLWSVAE